MALIIKISTVEVASIASFNFLNLVTATSKPMETKKYHRTLCDRVLGNCSELRALKKNMIHDTTSLRIWKQYECHRSAVDQPSSQSAFKKRTKKTSSKQGNYFPPLRRLLRGLVSVSPLSRLVLSGLLPLALLGLLGLLGSLASGFFSKNCLDFLFFAIARYEEGRNLVSWTDWGEYRTFCSTAVARLDLRKSGKAVVALNNN